MLGVGIEDGPRVGARVRKQCLVLMMRIVFIRGV